MLIAPFNPVRTVSRNSWKQHVLLMMSELTSLLLSLAFLSIFSFVGQLLQGATPKHTTYKKQSFDVVIAGHDYVVCDLTVL